MLFNIVTTITIAIGVLSLYLALFAAAALCAFGLIPSDVLAGEVGHSADPSDYLHLAWFGASIATLAGALGSMTESDLTVREAAYRYTPEVQEED
jgi:hypothetical protein